MLTAYLSMDEVNQDLAVRLATRCHMNMQAVAGQAEGAGFEPSPNPRWKPRILRKAAQNPAH
jgi:hypothetical protein